MGDVGQSSPSSSLWGEVRDLSHPQTAHPRRMIMFESLLSALESLFAGLNSGGFLSMDVNAMNAGFNNQLNAQMQAAQNQMIQSSMNNPQVMQMYQAHRQQGGQLDIRTFCLQYADTAGFTPQGYANLAQSRNQINNNDARNMHAYHQHSSQLQQQTVDHRNAIHDKWAEQRSENLSGQSHYVNSADGTAWQLPNMASPGQTYRDPASGNSFEMDPHGQYWMNTGDGWWQSMHPRG